MDVKKLKLFNNIILLSNKNVNKDIMHLGNTELLLKYLRQNLLLVSEIKKNRFKFKPRVVICFSDSYLMELATLIKTEIFIEKKAYYQVSVMESKDFYMNVPQDTKLVVFVGKVDSKYMSFCLLQKIFLINVVFPKLYDKTNIYNLPFRLDHLSALIWVLLLYRNI